MIAADLKAAVLRYMRFEKQMIYVSTEAGAYSSDVLASNGKSLIEVEVKVTRSDLWNDFKKQKHKFFQQARERNKPSGGWDHCPNYFYFAVTPELEQDAIELIKGKYPYGVLVCKFATEFSLGNCWPIVGVKCVLPAKKLHGEPVSQSALRCIVQRMSSELVAQTNLAAVGRSLKLGLDQITRTILEKENMGLRAPTNNEGSE